MMNTIAMLRLQALSPYRFNKAIGLTLRHIRQQRRPKLSQEALASRLEVSRSTYSGYERGTIGLPLQVALRFLVVTDTSIDYFLTEIAKRTSTE